MCSAGYASTSYHFTIISKQHEGTRVLLIFHACAALPAVKGPADGLLVVSAAKVVIANATTLTLSGIANTTSWVKYPPSPRAGAIAEVRDRCAGTPPVLPPEQTTCSSPSQAATRRLRGRHVDLCSGVLQTYLVSQSMAAPSGSWVGNPQSSLTGLQGGKAQTLLLQLDA